MKKYILLALAIVLTACSPEPITEKSNPIETHMPQAPFTPSNCNRMYVILESHKPEPLPNWKYSIRYEKGGSTKYETYTYPKYKVLNEWYCPD